MSRTSETSNHVLQRWNGCGRSVQTMDISSTEYPTVNLPQMHMTESVVSMIPYGEDLKSQTSPVSVSSSPTV